MTALKISFACRPGLQ